MNQGTRVQALIAALLLGFLVVASAQQANDLSAQIKSLDGRLSARDVHLDTQDLIRIALDPSPGS
jgi:hypothetical protein